MLAPEYGGDNHKRSDNTDFDKPLIAFPAHWAPLQMCLYEGTQFPEKYRGGMFLAFHGSWNRAPMPQGGYRVVFIPFDESGMPRSRWENFATGFPGPEFNEGYGRVDYRPCGVAAAPDGSLYIGDTDKGRIWRVIYTGETNAARTQVAFASSSNFNPVGADTPGGKLFGAVCAACHMNDGRGVPSMHPPLAGDPVLGGDTDMLINILLQGPAAVLPPDRPKLGGAMPAFSVFSDADIANVLNYARANFATNSTKVTPEQVASLRAKLK
jgi:mono/diheme cytochrome c family protein